MRQLCLLFLFFACLLGCREVVVRDAKVYKQEIDFIEVATLEHVERSKALMILSCSCTNGDEGLYFDDIECEELADTVVVLESRMEYHLNYMRFLGGLTDEEPGELPEIPEAISICEVLK